jgi:ariadne-1
MASDDRMLAYSWEQKNTKPCPKCASRIEKDGGCNHMTCKNCNHEFCWICGHEWNSHNGDGYNCNTSVDFDKKFGGDPASKGAHTRRAAMFVGHHIAHLQSQRNEAKKREQNLQRLLSLFMDSGMKGDAAQELAMRTVSAVETARSVLIWSYPYAYYLPDKELSEKCGLALFQYVQAQLCIYVDELTDCIENKHKPQVKAVHRFLATVEKNTEVLLKHAAG